MFHLLNLCFGNDEFLGVVVAFGIVVSVDTVNEIVVSLGLVALGLETRNFAWQTFSVAYLPQAFQGLTVKPGCFLYLLFLT